MSLHNAKRARIIALALPAVAALVVLWLCLRALQPSPAWVTVQGWQRHALPVLSPSQPWEENNVSEPDVWRDPSGWHMIYTGGWRFACLGAAASPDGLHWAKGPAPIVGGGAAGWPDRAAESSTLRDGGRLYVYFSPSIDHREREGGNLLVAVGRSPEHLKVRAAPAMRSQGAAQGIVNTCVWHEGDHYEMIFESDVNDASHWQMGHAIAARPEGPFHVIAFPLKSLQIGDGTFGGPFVQRLPRGYRLWYHAARHGFLPTALYCADSLDLTHWEHPHLVADRALPWEVDQVADPCAAPNGSVYYSGMDNPTMGGRIGLIIQR